MEALMTTPALVAVLCWGRAAKRLRERDRHIGWDAVTCANRLKLVVQLRRFYVIGHARNPKAIRHPFSAKPWAALRERQPLKIGY